MRCMKCVLEHAYKHDANIKPASPRLTGRDPELTGLPGTRLRWVTIAVAGAGADARLVRGGVLGISVGVEKARSAGCCWPAAPPLRGPTRLLKGVLLIERAGTKVLGCLQLGPAANWARRERPCPGSSSLGPLAAMSARAVHVEFNMSQGRHRPSGCVSGALR